MSEDVKQHWPQLPEVRVTTFEDPAGRKGAMYYNSSQKEVSVRFDWRADLPEYGIDLWKEGRKAREVFRPSLYGGRGGMEVSWQLAPGETVVAFER